MNSMWGLAPVAIVLLAFVFSRWRRRRHEQRLMNQPFPEQWKQVLRERMPVYAALRPEERSTLECLVKRFLDEKEFYGCAGLVVTDRMKLCIAAESCLLLLGQSGPIYPKLRSILVYPSGFIARRDVHREDGTVASGEHHLLGESWGNGRVILSWDDVEEGARDFSDGHNVVLHEFAHQLDSASGDANGAPPLRANSYQTWARVFSDSFDDLRARVTHGRPTVMDPYGASNPAEFFAVATETFFEKPGDLFARRPDLFEELRQYYRVDPREWHRRIASEHRLESPAAAP